MIRVELIHGRRGGWAALPTAWLSMGGGAIAVVAVLYFMPITQLLSIWQTDEPPLNEPPLTAMPAVATATAAVEQEHVLPAPIASSADVVTRPPVAVVVPPVLDDRESGGAVVQGLVLPPVGAMPPSDGVMAQSSALAVSGSAPRQSNACPRAMGINKLLPAGINISLLSCGSAGGYKLMGTSKSAADLTELEQVLQRLPSRVTLSSWRVDEVLHFSFAGHFDDVQSAELATLSAAQAQRLFRKVEHWADQCGLDGISFHKPIEVALSSTRARMRRKLWGTGSFQQISAFLVKLRQVEETATLGELVLTPVRSGGRGWVEARLYMAVDAVVGVY